MLNFINSLSEDLTERRDLNSVLEDLNEDFSDLNVKVIYFYRMVTTFHNWIRTQTSIWIL
jgi:hypothetical protein